MESKREFISIPQDNYSNESQHNNCTIYKIPKNKGSGYIRELNYHKGLFISASDFTLKDYTERNLEPFDENFIEIIYLESGTMTRSQKGYKNTVLKQGINTFVNNHKPIKLLYQPNCPIRFVIVTLYSSFYDEYISEKFPNENTNFLDVFKSTELNCNTPEISLIFRQIKQKMLSDIDNRMYYESKVGEIMSILTNNANQYAVNKNLSNKLFNKTELIRLKEVAQILEKSLSTRPTIEELSKVAQMSPTKLKSSFKVEYNTTITQYSIHCRLKHSLILLANTDKNISDIALAVGYKNSSKFSKTFTKVFGLYPKDYRKSLKIE